MLVLNNDSIVYEIDKNVLKERIMNLGWNDISDQPKPYYGCAVRVDVDGAVMLYNEIVCWNEEKWIDADGEEVPYKVVAWHEIPSYEK